MSLRLFHKDNVIEVDRMSGPMYLRMPLLAGLSLLYVKLVCSPNYLLTPFTIGSCCLSISTFTELGQLNCRGNLTVSI